MELSVLTFNIHKGKHAFLARESLHQIEAFLGGCAADLILLQEIVGSDPRRGAADQVAHLAEKLGLGYCYGMNRVSGTYHHGNAILSRHPIRAWKNEDLSTNRYERRGVLDAVIELPNGTPLRAYCSHLNLLRESRQAQLGKIGAILDRTSPGAQGVSILGGDLNDWNRDADRIFTDRGWKEVGVEASQKHYLTFPAWWPKMPLDRIYYRGAKLVSSEVVPLKKTGWISDHLPVLARFVLED